MAELTQEWRLPWRSLVVATIAIAVAAASGGTTALELERELVVTGEWWRCLTGHLVHGSSYHLWWNILPLLGLGLLWEPLLGRRYWGLCVLSALVVGVGLVLLDPEMIGYVGLSGVLNGVWIAGALLAARQEAARGSRWQWLYVGFVTADLGKIVFEAFSGLQLFTKSSALGVHAVPLAHALGALSGVLWIILVVKERPFGDSGNFGTPEVPTPEVPTQVDSDCPHADTVRSLKSKRPIVPIVTGVRSRTSVTASLLQSEFRTSQGRYGNQPG